MSREVSPDPSPELDASGLVARVAVITLVQNQDFPTAWTALHSIEQQLSSDRSRFVLINDSVDEDIVGRLRDLPHTEIIAPGENLGVAAGRNVLIKHALEWGADLIVTLDDDLLVPINYLEHAVLAMEMDNGPLIATPILLDYHAIASSIHSSEQIRGVEEGDTAPFMQSLSIEDVFHSWRQLDEPDQGSVLHHMGIREWERHYFAPLGSTARRLGDAVAAVVDLSDTDPGDSRPTELRNDELAVRSILANDKRLRRIDCAPGGSTIYRRSALEKVGLLEEAFSPFGYEDADICIRARRVGLQVGLLQSVALLHDLQSRHKRRDPLVGVATRAKARALLIRLHSDDRSVAATRAFDALVVGSLEANMYSHARGGAISAALAYVAGALAGVFAQLSSARRFNPTSGSDISPYITLHHPVTYLSDEPIDGLLPRVFSGSAPFTVPIRSTVFSRSLPFALSGRVSGTYRLDASGLLSVDDLAILIPGLFRLEVSGLIGGVPVDGRAVDPIESTVIHSLNVRVTDSGLIDAFENTRAWLGGWPSSGLLRSLAKNVAGDAGAAIREFLNPGNSAKALTIHIHPRVPLGIKDLQETPGGPWHISKTLGLTVRCHDPLVSATAMGTVD